MSRFTPSPACGDADSPTSAADTDGGALYDAGAAYNTAGIKPGAVVIAIYNGKASYGVFGDEGPSGVDNGVTYIVFTGAGAVATPIEDHHAAVILGQQLATTLRQNN